MVAVKKAFHGFGSSLREQKTFGGLAGFIFVCNDLTVPDLERKIFGLPLHYAESVQAIREGMPLFLFNYSTRYMHGIFEAASNGGFNLDPYAWGQLDPTKAAGRYHGPISKYPAQVRVRLKIQRLPLDEKTFRPVLDHYEGHKFRLELTSDQVHKLFQLFSISGLSRDVDEGYSRLPLQTLAYQDPSFPIIVSKPDLDGYRGASFEKDDLEDETCVQESTPNHLNYHSGCQTCFCGNLHVPWEYKFFVDDNGVANDKSSLYWQQSLQKPQLNRKMDSPLVTLKYKLSSRPQEITYAVHSSTHSPCIHGRNEIQIDTSLFQPKFLGAENIVYKPQPGRQKVSAESCEEPLQLYYQKLLGGSEVVVNKQILDYGDSYKEKDSHVSDCNEIAYTPQAPLLLSQTLQSGPYVPLPMQTTLMLSPIVLSSMPQCFSVAQPVSSTVENVMEEYQQSGIVKLQSMQLESQTAELFMPPWLPFNLPQFTSVLEGLHFDILQFARQTRPSSETIFHVEAAIICVQDAVKSLWPQADVEVFGSFATGLCLQHSDVDLAVVGAPSIVSSGKVSSSQISAFLIKELAAVLRHCEWCESYNVVANATVPVFKCVCRPFRRLWGSFVDSPVVAIDITIADRRTEVVYNQPKKVNKGPRIGKFGLRHTGGAAREYVLNKICELPALTPLVLLLKSFLQHRGLSNVYSGGLGSFTLILLLIYYLERNPTSSMMPKQWSFDDTRCNSVCDLSVFPDDSCCYHYEGMASNCSLGNIFIRRAAAVVDRVLALWESNSSLSLGTLLLGFLHTFGTVLDLSHVKIVLKGKDGSLGGLFKRDNQHIALWIDDPLRPGMNVGAGSYAMCQVQDAFRDMLEVFINQQVPTAPLHCTENTCLDLDAISGLPHLSLLV